MNKIKQIDIFLPTWYIFCEPLIVTGEFNKGWCKHLTKQYKLLRYFMQS
ncbi:hypothetical protein HMPREF1987_02156 [Peptostreptococcaceae bacterium oral taxon 113 str. W5053]|nr:hypothetical protein HMPREF1987_02156 [Peptostreptococcaceae bacterium oral taxon 113 str. W5053]